MKKNKYFWFLVIILLYGFILRLAHYITNRSLWLDEAFIALNIINKSFFQLVDKLDYCQAAPIGFLFIEKISFIKIVL